MPVNPHPKGGSLPRGKRQNDIVCSMGGIERDIIRIHLPAGYAPESLPQSVSLDTEWGTFTSTCEVEGSVVTVFQEFETKRFRESADRFDDFRTFVRAVNKAYGAQLVLARQ